MHWKKRLYITHRWLALVVSLQLLAWSVGGFMFSILDIDNVHGDWERNFTTPAAIDPQRVKLSASEAITAAVSAGVGAELITNADLRVRRGQTIYELRDAEGDPLAVVSAETGDVTRQIGESEATAIALADFSEPAEVTSVELLKGDPPGEFRDNPMPVYRVMLKHPKYPHLYISPVTGEVLKRRNGTWRIFDFLWMLHIMDYRDRTDFNHWLLTGMSSLAILTSASGLALWSFRIPKRKRIAVA